VENEKRKDWQKEFLENQALRDAAYKLEKEKEARESEERLKLLRERLHYTEKDYMFLMCPRDKIFCYETGEYIDRV
jgi:hypothetical protein